MNKYIYDKGKRRKFQSSIFHPLGDKYVLNRVVPESRRYRNIKPKTNAGKNVNGIIHKPQRDARFKDITKNELVKLMHSEPNTILLLDLRSKGAYEKTHIFGAKSFPFQNMSRSSNMFKLVPEVYFYKNKSDKFIVIYDSRGEFNARAGIKFYEMNFANVFRLDGGILEFEKKFKKFVVTAGNVHAMNIGNYELRKGYDDDVEEVDLVDRDGDDVVKVGSGVVKKREANFVTRESENDQKNVSEEDDEEEFSLDPVSPRDKYIEDRDNDFLFRELSRIKEKNVVKVKEKKRMQIKKRQDAILKNYRQLGIMNQEHDYLVKFSEKEKLQNLEVPIDDEMQKSIDLMNFPKKFTYPLIHDDRYLIGKHAPPFMKSLVLPPSHSSRQSDKFDNYLQLEWIYGTSRKGVTGKMMYLNSEKKLVYISAAVGVIYDPVTHTQRHFIKHEDDILAINMHPNKLFFVTGGCGKGNMIYIWNSSTLEVVKEIHGHKYFGDSGTGSLCFDSTGNYLWVIGGPLPNVVVFVWQKTGKNFVGGLKKLARYDTLGLFANPVTHQVKWLGKGARYYSFVEEDRMIIGKNALINTRGGKLQQFFDVVFDKLGRNYVGTKSGYVYVLNEKHLIYKKKCHQGPVYSLGMFPDFSQFASGSSRLVKIWKLKQFKRRRKARFRMKSKTGVKRRKAPKTEYFELSRVINIGYNVGSLVCFSSNLIYGLSRDDGAMFEMNVSSTPASKRMISNFHQDLDVECELWGLATFQNNNEYFLTCGDDGRIILFSRTQKRSLCAFQVKREGKIMNLRGISVHPSSLHFAVSSKCGKVFVYLLSPIMHNKKPLCLKELVPQGDTRIEGEVKVLRYSPDGRLLAVASKDHSIYVFSVPRRYSLYCVLRGHVSTITHLDWSVDSKYIQSVSSSYEFLYFDAKKKSIVPNPSTMRDMKWFTQSCILGWNVKGMWDMSIYNDGTDINNCWVDFRNKLLISVDDMSCVNVFKYPSVKSNPMKKSYIGHCSHVTNVRVSNDGKYAFTTGGGDLTVFQWKIMDKYVEKSVFPVGRLMDYGIEVEKKEDGVVFKE